MPRGCLCVRMPLSCFLTLSHPGWMLETRGHCAIPSRALGCAKARTAKRQPQSPSPVVKLHVLNPLPSNLGCNRIAPYLVSSLRKRLCYFFFFFLLYNKLKCNLHLTRPTARAYTCCPCESNHGFFSVASLWLGGSPCPIPPVVPPPVLCHCLPCPQDCSCS